MRAFTHNYLLWSCLAHLFTICQDTSVTIWKSKMVSTWPDADWWLTWSDTWLKAELHPKKRMFCVWWGVKGVIYWELLPEKNTVTGTVYRAQISRFNEQFDIVGPRGPKVYFQHDNARPHASETVRQKLDSLGWTVIPHPPYSPDLAPSDYHIFVSLSNHLRGKNYRDEEELKSFSSVFRFSVIYLGDGHRS